MNDDINNNIERRRRVIL